MSELSPAFEALWQAALDAAAERERERARMNAREPWETLCDAVDDVIDRANQKRAAGTGTGTEQ